MANNSRFDNELLEAAWNGDVERVKELLALGANPECTDEIGDTANTPLHLAIENLHLEVVQLLLDCGADVNGRTADGYWTPLVHAVEVVSDAASQLSLPPDNNLVRLLVQYGADVNAATSEGETALGMLRRAFLNKEAEEVLIAAGAREIRTAK